MSIAGKTAEQRTMHRLAGQLEQAAIPYAVMGPLAVGVHGARSIGNEVVFLLGQQGLKHFRTDFVGTAYDQVPRRPRRFVDRQNGLTVHVKVAGHYPGRSGPGPFPYPEPNQASEEINHVRVLTLPLLIQLNLAERRFQDLADVVSLISAHQLDESFLDELHPSVHRDYIRCLEEKRREDEFNAAE